MSSSKTLVELIKRWSDTSMKLSFQDFKEIMSSTGLSFPQIGILTRISHRGNFNISEMGEKMGVSNAAASQAIERLVVLGLIKRTEDPTDRRSRRLALTPKGQEIVEKGIEARSKWIEEVVEDLNPDQQKKIIESLNLLSDAALKRREGSKDFQIFD